MPDKTRYALAYDNAVHTKWTKIDYFLMDVKSKEVIKDKAQIKEIIEKFCEK
jgi:hypothetical protein